MKFYVTAMSSKSSYAYFGYTDVQTSALLLAYSTNFEAKKVADGRTSDK